MPPIKQKGWRALRNSAVCRGFSLRICIQRGLVPAPGGSRATVRRAARCCRRRGQRGRAPGPVALGWAQPHPSPTPWMMGSAQGEGRQIPVSSWGCSMGAPGSPGHELSQGRKEPLEGVWSKPMVTPEGLLTAGTWAVPGCPPTLPASAWPQGTETPTLAATPSPGRARLRGLIRGCSFLPLCCPFF